jgi:hypothetical protein
MHEVPSPMVTKEEIEKVYSSTLLITPPPNIYYLRNGEIGATDLHAMTQEKNYDCALLECKGCGDNFSSGAEAVRHAYNRFHYDGEPQHMKYVIYGMHAPQTDFIMLAKNARPETPLHEAVHYSGMHNEARTRLRTAWLYPRASMNAGIIRRQVHYEEVPMTQAEKQAILSEMHLHKSSGANEDIVHYVYRP